MRRAWDIELIFPMKDAASAALMVMKADCLHNAGVISDSSGCILKRVHSWPMGRSKTQPDRTWAIRRLMRGGEFNQDSELTASFSAFSSIALPFVSSIQAL
jgi:hypothetical protein